VGTKIGVYRIEAVLGRGGMGVVYRATQMYPKRQVALKLLAPSLASDATFRERFFRESNSAAAIDHPNILPIYDAGEAEGTLYLAMRFVEGKDLHALVAHQGSLTPAHSLDLLGQIAAALDAAHERGLIHRDVKPGNILVSKTGSDVPEHCYLTDFGLTKMAPSGTRLTEISTSLTESGQVIGTPDFMAPEQIDGRATDSRTDQYALGCVLWVCLTGEVPFPREHSLAILYAHLSEPPPRLSDASPALPKALDRVLERVLAKDPNDRFPSCRSLIRTAREASGLERRRRLAKRTGLRSTKETTLERKGGQATRRRTDRWRTAAAASAGVALVAITVLLAQVRINAPAVPTSPTDVLVPEVTIPELPRPTTRVVERDEKDPLAFLDIATAEVEAQRNEIRLVVTAHRAPPAAGRLVWNFDSTGSLRDGCEGFEWRVITLGTFVQLQRFRAAPACTFDVVDGATPGSGTERSIAIVVGAEAFRAGFPTEFRWQAVGGLGVTADEVPTGAPARFP